MRILLVEDEEKLATTWAAHLKAEGFAVEMAFGCAYDLVVLDIMLPGLDGTQVLQRIRERNREIPVLMLTARDSVQDKIKNFEAGADDYLTKPFSFAEFLLRIKSLLRRVSTQLPNTIHIGDFCISARRARHRLR